MKIAKVDIIPLAIPFEFGGKTLRFRISRLAKPEYDVGPDRNRYWCCGLGVTLLPTIQGAPFRAF